MEKSTNENPGAPGFRGDVDYLGIVEHINDGVVILVEDRIVFANGRFCAMSRTSREKLLNTGFADFICPEDRERVIGSCKELLLGQAAPDAIEFLMPGEGEAATIVMKVATVAFGGGQAIMGALTDVTERRRARMDLQKVKGRLESIIHAMHEVVVSFSVDDYEITSINPAAEALYGVPLRDFTSGERHIVDFVHPDDLDTVNRFYQNLPEAEFDETVYRIISSDGRQKWVLDEGHIVLTGKGAIRRIDHVIRDITEEKKTVDALSRSEEKCRSFLDSTSDMAFTLTREGTFSDINDAGFKLLGFGSREEALASNFGDFFPDVSKRAELLSEIYERGRLAGKHLKLQNRAGELIEVAVTARAKMDESGDLLFVEGIIHNITKALEDQSNKVLRNAAGSMCHYLNTHLMQLQMCKEAIAEEIASLDGIVDRFKRGDDIEETSLGMKQAMERIRYFSESLGRAYDKVSEVTTAFNNAFHYREEAYVSGTILDIFKAHGYDGNE